MARIALGIVAAVIIGLAVWAAVPSTPPLANPSVHMQAVQPSPQREAEQQPSPAAAAPVPDGDLDAKITACLAAQDKVAQARAQRGGPAPAGQPSDAAVVAGACAPLYRQPACRDAMVHFDTPPPAERSRTVLQACARAYCGELPAPKPSVCAHPDNVPDDEQQFMAWNELREAILKHDLGPAAAARALSPPARSR